MPKKRIILIGVVAFVIALVAFGSKQPAKKANASPLDASNVIVQDAHNISGNVVGQYGFIPILKSEFNDVTPEEYDVFTKSVVQAEGAGYGYFTLDFCDGTGIVFIGCTTEASVYCHIGDDREACESIIYYQDAGSTDAFLKAIQDK